MLCHLGREINAPVPRLCIFPNDYLPGEHVFRYVSYISMKYFIYELGNHLTSSVKDTGMSVNLTYL